MRRFPDRYTPSAEDQRTYRRWTAGLYLTYFAIVLFAIGLTFTIKPADETTASNDVRIARSESTPVPASVRSPARPAIKP
ncbi:MAG: hypothetical protein ABW175_11750 [Bradyrhizobium sp.]